VTITSSYSGADSGNYSVTDQSSTTADISTKALTATASASNKTYNASNSASVTLILSGLVGSETLGSINSSTFNNKNVGTGKTITVNSITLADGSNGGLAANYSISAGQTTTANITAKSLTVSGITASNKIYDGNGVATLDASSVAYSGLVSGDTFNGTFIGAFSDKNVGTGKTVTITPSYSGADVNNYSITNHADVTANITAKALTVSGVTASDKTYDSNVTATMDSSSVVYNGLVSGDIFTGSYSGVFANANVGTGKTVTITSSYTGVDVSNYSVTDQTSTTSDISAKVLTATASTSDKVYNGSSASTTSLSLSGFIGSETVTSTNSSTFNNKNVGTGKTVTVNSITLADGANGGLASNYSINTGQTSTANVTAKTLTVSGITTSNKVYDSTTTATTTLSFSGLIGSETINNTNSSTFDNKNIGTAKAVTVNSITLVDGNNGGLASNYSINSGQTTSADISAKQITVSGISASSKSYDGTTSITLDTSSVNYNGLVSGDDLTGSFSGVFVNDNVGTGRVINITSSYSGDDIGNYNIINQNTHFADITIGNPTISGLSNQTKSFTTSSYTLTGTPSISGLPIVYSSSDTSVATVNSSTGEVTFVNVGSVTISANIVSTLNYNSTTSSYLLEINLNTTNFNSDSSSSIVKQVSVLQTRTSSSENFNLRTFVKQNDANISAKIVVVKDDLNANVDSLYTEESGDGKLSTDFIDEEEKEKFDKPGDIIKEKTIVLKLSDTESYNYKLEFRQKGLVIKPLDTNSGYFANLNKSVVIKSAITEIKNIAGYLKSQIRTIIFDLANKF
ncbi:MAG: beta strand repeat-containing protein, partial [Candidatus Puniceispirillales bacterium]